MFYAHIYSFNCYGRIYGRPLHRVIDIHERDTLRIQIQYDCKKT